MAAIFGFAVSVFGTQWQLVRCFGLITGSRVLCESRTRRIINVSPADKPTALRRTIIRLQARRTIMNSSDDLVDMLMHDVGQSVSRARVEEVTSEVAAQFADAKVDTYIPIFVRREVRARLREEIRRSTNAIA